MKARIVMRYENVIVFTLICLIFTILLSSSVIFSLNADVLGIRADDENIVVKGLRQGWGFFSKDTREPMLSAYPSSENNSMELQWPNNTISNLLGLSRSGRAQGIELGSIIKEIPNEGFMECKENYRDCIDNGNEIIDVNNIYDNPTICGEWGVVLLEPVPWAWSDTMDELDMPASVAKVDVTCSID